MSGGYPGTEHEKRIDAGALRAFATGVFSRCGMRPADASLVADTLAMADLRGVHSHGVLRVPDYAGKLRRGGVNPMGEPRVVQDAAAALVIDGGNSMGQVAASFAMRRAIERAREINVAVAAVRASNHCGAMFYYAMQALKEDMVGIAATNALPTMAPWGGLDKIVGINPLGVAIPAAAEGPIVLDAAFSYSSHGKIRVYRQGAAYGNEVGNMVDGPRPGLDGHFFMALRIAAFEDVARFKERIDEIVQRIRTGRRSQGVDHLYAPGGLEGDREAAYRRDGIPLNDATLDGLSTVAGELGMPFELDSVHD